MSLQRQHHFNFDFICITFTVDLVSGNLSKVQNLIWDARLQWFNLGLALEVNEIELGVIEENNRSKVEECFRNMLSKWLKMVEPRPTWEGLIAALKQPSVRHKKLARELKVKFDMPLELDDEDGKCSMYILLKVEHCASFAADNDEERVGE